MASQPFGAFIEIESKAEPNTLQRPEPAKVLSKDAISIAPPTEYELQTFQWGSRLNGPVLDESTTSIPPTPRELEHSLPTTPKHNQAVDAIVNSATNPYMNRWRLASAGLLFFAMGMNDSATGALIPYLEQDYQIGYAIVSLVFITNAIGFIIAAPLVQVIDGRFGRSRTYMFATLLLVAGYTILACAPPFPVVVLSFFLLGFGYALFLALTNSFIVNLVNGTTILGAMHGTYGLGGVVAPLAATAMVSRGVRWSYFYLITLVLASICFVAMGWSYKCYEKDSVVQLLTALERTASKRAEQRGEPTGRALLKQSLKNRTTLLGALFIFAYQGAEVSISGWVISFLIRYRKGNPAQVGNVTSGFWGGITVGRFALTHFAHKIGEKRSVYGLVIGAAVFQLLVWFIPNIIGNAVAEAIVGVFLGPVYPCATAIFSRLLPRNIQISSLGFIASMGSSGGALAPFLTGLLAQKVGTEVLHPICLALFVVMEVSWFGLPRVMKRTE